MAKSRLLQFELNERTWHILATTPELAPQLEGCEGLCVYEHDTILIDATRSKETQRQALVHELLHAAVHESHAWEVLMKLCEVDHPDLRTEFEETFLLLLTKTLCETPIVKTPRGWVELTAAEARAWAKGKV